MLHVYLKRGVWWHIFCVGVMIIGKLNQFNGEVPAFLDRVSGSNPFTYLLILLVMSIVFYGCVYFGFRPLIQYVRTYHKT